MSGRTVCLGIWFSAALCADPQQPGPSAESAHTLTARGLENLSALARLFGYVRYFHPADEAAAADWNQLAIAAVRAAEPARNPAELAAALRSIFAPVAPTVQIFPADSEPPALGLSPAGPMVMWEHHGVAVSQPPMPGYRSARIVVPAVKFGDALWPFRAKLPGGVSCIVPIALSIRSARPPLEPAAARAPDGTAGDRARTGQRVLKQDGSPLFGVGVTPTIPVALRRKALAGGRDEVLERAMEALKR